MLGAMSCLTDKLRENECRDCKQLVRDDLSRINPISIRKTALDLTSLGSDVSVKGLNILPANSAATKMFQSPQQCTQSNSCLYLIADFFFFRVMRDVLF